MTPRTELIDEYLPILAHETAHALHRMVLELGEKAGVLEKGATELVPGSVMEDFSQLVEDQFHSDKKLPYKKKYKGKEFPNFRAGLVQRYQVPYALMQLGIRKYFDKLWNEGYRDFLKDEMVWEIKERFDPDVKAWAKLGIYIKRDRYNSLNYFSATDPGDGLVYMKKYIVDAPAGGRSASYAKAAKGKTSVKSESMAAAFEKRYGKDWIKNKEARTVLLWLLLETGRNSASETFSEYILNGEPKEYLKELNQLGIKATQI
jgi:hypothetical protein